MYTVLTDLLAVPLYMYTWKYSCCVVMTMHSALICRFNQHIYSTTQFGACGSKSHIYLREYAANFSSEPTLTSVILFPISFYLPSARHSVWWFRSLITLRSCLTLWRGRISVRALENEQLLLLFLCFLSSLFGLKYFVILCHLEHSLILTCDVSPHEKH